VTKINEETGEYLILGMGQLHLEIATKGIQFYEATEEQLINLATRWLPEVKWEFVPLLNKIKYIETYQKLNK